MFSLRWVRSIKLKFSIVIVAAIGVAVVMSQVGYALGWPLWLRPSLAVLVSLVLVQILAHGMTSPLRDMASAAQEISRGDLSRRIQTPSVDEVGQLATAFNEMASDLADVERHRRELIANVSHELRTPIAGIRAALENVIDGVVQPTPALLSAMHGRVQRLQRLIDDLLDLSRFESGTVVIDRRPVRLDDVVSGAVDEARFDHPDTDIMVFGSTSDSSSLLVLGDPERLHQVIANLIDNALIHGSAPVELHLSESAAGVRLRVTDCGVGLPPGPPQRVFDRFFRGAATQAPTENDQYTDGIGHPSIRAGTGLGLAIVRWIVELHGGSIAAGANHPVGARFDVILPAAPPITPANPSSPPG